MWKKTKNPNEKTSTMEKPVQLRHLDSDIEIA